MSTNAVRQRMTHRAVVERNTATGTDAYNQPAAPVFTTHIAAQSCWFYAESGRSAGDEVARQRGIVVMEQLRMLVPLDADIAEADRINGVTDRQGNTIYAGILHIRSVLPVHTHKQLRLEAVA